ncbi:hypothetical protein M513_12510 [Trichuris suis]|uniref:Inner centromere protein ARK-binding domain-containing protein n=1 Tax=Trichuris suis TaxID=68888 RepID=A0A085LNR5_9BILA|nr:hypothetical protein M513_12510 [Trichuris suis]
MSGRKQKNAIMPSVLPSLEDILEESAVKNSLRNVARCVMKRRADRVQAKAGKQRPKRTEKSSPEVPKGPANHSSEPKRRPKTKLCGRKQKNAIMPSVQPSLEDILEESAVKNSLRNVARCVMKRRADRVQAKAGKQRPKKTEKSSPEVPKRLANHSSEPKRRPIGKRREERLPATHRYNLRSRRKEEEEPIKKQSGPASTKRRRKPIPPSPCSIEPERERSSGQMVTVCSSYDSPIVRADLRSMEACSSQTLETPSDIYSAQLHSMENTNGFETPILSFRKDSSQQLTGQMGNAVSTPKSRNENGLDIYVDDFGIEYAFYEDPMRYTVTIEILDSPPEMTEKTASASGGDVTLQAVTEDGDSEALVLATKTSVDTSLLMDKTALTISDAEHSFEMGRFRDPKVHLQLSRMLTKGLNQLTLSKTTRLDLTHLQSEEHDIQTTVTEALAANENSTRLTGGQHDFGGDVSTRVLPAVQESVPLLVEEEDADATCVVPSKEDNCARRCSPPVGGVPGSDEQEEAVKFDDSRFLSFRILGCTPQEHFDQLTNRSYGNKSFPNNFALHTTILHCPMLLRNYVFKELPQEGAKGNRAEERPAVGSPTKAPKKTSPKSLLKRIQEKQEAAARRREQQLAEKIRSRQTAQRSRQFPITPIRPNLKTGHLIVTPGNAKGELKDPSAFLPPELLANFATPAPPSTVSLLYWTNKVAISESLGYFDIREGGSDDGLSITARECRQSSPSLSTATYTEYEITERVLSSDEECDGNDEEPPKKIPRWANDDQVKLAYVAQLQIEHPERIFAGCLRPITLKEVFGTDAELDSIRSSAQWDTSSDCAN